MLHQDKLPRCRTPSNIKYCIALKIDGISNTIGSDRKPLSNRKGCSGIKNVNSLGRRRSGAPSLSLFINYIYHGKKKKKKKKRASHHLLVDQRVTYPMVRCPSSHDLISLLT
ncbi:hypothetical protein V6N13_087336 [Hibiscus sabdariffa]